MDMDDWNNDFFIVVFTDSFEYYTKDFYKFIFKNLQVVFLLFVVGK